MKTLKCLLPILVITFFVNSNLYGQTYHQQVVVHINGIDYGEPIGVVWGTYTYQYSFRLDESGKLINMHWNVIDNDLLNDSGDKVRVIDSGHDTFGAMWYLWNNIGAWNGDAPIEYEVEDGWLDEIMPDPLPLEGTVAKMSTKVMCKGTTYSLAGLLQIHMNANGDITAEVRKGWYE